MISTLGTYSRQVSSLRKNLAAALASQRKVTRMSKTLPCFRPRRHLLNAEEYRREMANRFSTWNEVTGLTTAA